MICNNCKKEIPDGKKYCIYCGIQLEEANEVKILDDKPEIENHSTNTEDYSSQDLDKNKERDTQENNADINKKIQEEKKDELTSNSILQKNTYIRQLNKSQKVVYIILLIIILICLAIGIGKLGQKMQEEESSKVTLKEKQTELSENTETEEILNIDDYLGDWEKIYNEENVLSLSLLKVRENYMAIVSADYKTDNKLLAFGTDTISLSLEGNKLEGYFNEDGWGNSGRIQIELKDDSILLSINSEPSDVDLDMGNSMDCENTMLYRRENNSEVPNSSISNENMSAEDFYMMTAAEVENIYGSDYELVQNEQDGLEMRYRNQNVPYIFCFFDYDRENMQLYTEEKVSMIIVQENGNIDDCISPTMTVPEIMDLAKNMDATVGKGEMNDLYTLTFSTENHEGTVYANAESMDMPPVLMFVKFEY